MPSASSTAFQEHFAMFEEAARHQPVAITDPGRDSLVLLSAAE